MRIDLKDKRFILVVAIIIIVITSLVLLLMGILGGSDKNKQLSCTKEETKTVLVLKTELEVTFENGKVNEIKKTETRIFKNEERAAGAYKNIENLNQAAGFVLEGNTITSVNVEKQTDDAQSRKAFKKDAEKQGMICK